MSLFPLRFSPHFVKELEATIAYYSSKSTNAGLQFKSATKKQLNLLKKNPHTRSIRYDDVRFARIEKFPYAIHYSIDAENNCVWVYALLSDYQDPETNWKKRI